MTNVRKVCHLAINDGFLKDISLWTETTTFLLYSWISLWNCGFVEKTQHSLDQALETPISLKYKYTQYLKVPGLVLLYVLVIIP